MIKDGINGFCMALADSVPGVSGGTVAFIMGFYDQFIGSINRLVFGSMKEKKTALRYLVRLGAGWAVGMISAVLVLSALFDSQIYVISSLFIGFIAGAIPLIVKEEQKSFRKYEAGLPFCILGIVLVAGITWLNGHVGSASMDLGQFSIGLGIKLFFIGMIAISAMFLPGISGSTLLLIFGAYISVITAIKGILGLDFSYFPGLAFFGLGVLTGAATVVKGIKICLERFRPQTVYAILGMMIGSFYAIVQGPTTLDVPKAAMNLGNFQIIACAVGVLLVLGMQKMRGIQDESGKKKNMRNRRKRVMKA